MSISLSLLALSMFGSPNSNVFFGEVVEYAGNEIPTGWFEANGQQLEIATYPELYAVLGHIYSGFDVDDETNPATGMFKLPDFSGRVKVGVDSTDPLFELGSRGGKYKHNITTAEMPEHYHEITDPGHRHTFGTSGKDSSWGYADRGNTRDVNRQTDTSKTGITVQPTGGSEAMSLMQPYVAIRSLIFAGDAVDCQIEWLEWSSCNVTCGGGIRTRSGTVLAGPRRGGKACPTDLNQSEECNTEPCQISCSPMGTWSDWSACTSECGGGVQLRNRTVIEPSASVGPCGAEQEVRLCNLDPCPSTCIPMEPWSNWAACTALCGTGLQMRSRTTTPSSSAGPPCGPLQELRECDTGITCPTNIAASGSSDNAPSSITIGSLVLVLLVLVFIILALVNRRRNSETSEPPQADSETSKSTQGIAINPPHHHGPANSNSAYDPDGATDLYGDLGRPRAPATSNDTYIIVSDEPASPVADCDRLSRRRNQSYAAAAQTPEKIYFNPPVNDDPTYDNAVSPTRSPIKEGDLDTAEVRFFRDPNDLEGQMQSSVTASSDL